MTFSGNGTISGKMLASLRGEDVYVTPAQVFWMSDRGDLTQSWLDKYWETKNEEYRAVLADAVCGLLPEQTGSVMEIGCHCGPNMAQILERYPKVYVVGVEASEVAARYGMARLGNGVPFIVGLFPAATKNLKDGAVDVTMTCHTMSSFHVDDLDDAIRELLRLSRIAAVIAEPSGQTMHHGGDVVVDEEKRVVKMQVELWQHDYEAAFQRIGIDPDRISCGTFNGAPDALNKVWVVRTGS